jgi:glycosyltransferase involved in cell wall biosynthesis
VKVALVSPSYYPAIGGVETHVKMIAEILAKEVDVSVYTLDHTAKSSAAFEINGVPVNRFPSRRLTYGIEIPSRELSRMLQSSDADIVHVHSLHALLPYYTYRAISSTGKNLVLTTHYHGKGHTWTRNNLFRIYKPFLSRIVRAADKVICVSEYEKKLVIEDFSIREDSISVIPNGISMPLSKFAHQQFKRNPSKILYVGRLESYKNVDKLVKAIDLLDGFTLSIVGEGPEGPRILKAVNELSLSDRVALKGKISDEELLQEYATSKIFVMPSYHEAYGIAVADALSMGMCAIVSKSGALSEFVESNYAYGIISPITPEKIARAIIEVSRNENPNSRYLPYTWTAAAEKVLAVYESTTTH